MIRPAREEDAPRLQHIELATHPQFAAIGLHNVAADPPDSIEVLVDFARTARSWVATTDQGDVVGYILLGTADGAAHIDQVTVHPDYQGRGVGKSLVDRAKAWAAETGRRAVTLTTFSEVPWNMPLYEHLGFHVMDDAEIGPELKAIQAHEVDKGFGPEGRVAMRFDLGAAP